MSFFKFRAGVAPLALIAGACTPGFAAPPSSSAYLTDPQSSHVEDETSRGIGQVNMITCIMSALRPDALVNEPSYIALVDEAKCDPESRSSSQNSGSDGAQGAASYITATVTSSRESNDDPMRTKAWLDFSDDEMNATIHVNISATAAPSESNPYGEFRLDFCGKPLGENSGSCFLQGFIEGADSGLNYFQTEMGEGNTPNISAMRLETNGATSGSGRMELSDSWEGDRAFTFAYNTDLFRRSSSENDDQCFSRDASDAGTRFSVWRYGLYNATTGERVTRNSGFPIEYTVEGATYHGYMGYYGLHLPPEASNTLTSGATVEKVDYSTGDEPTRTSYTVVRSAGKLIKYTKRTRTLAQLDQIKFTTFVGQEGTELFEGATPFTQYELYWDNAQGHFVVTGQMFCGENGCQSQDFDTEHHIEASFWASRGGVQGWSQSLGGELFINLSGISGELDASAVQVVYRSQDLVYPADMPETLYCVQNCPTAATLAAYFESESNDPSASPYVSSTYNSWSPVPLGGVVTYGINAQDAALIGGDGSDAAVVYTNAQAYRQRPQYQWGVRTGRLFTSLTDAACEGQSGTAYCDWKVSSAEVYYQWETGPNTWNQFAAVKDGSGEFVAFDAPLQVEFTVPDGEAFGQYAGKSIVLQYGGFGDLWGIPGVCVSRKTNEPVSCDTPESRYVPSFVIPYEESVGRVVDTENDTTYLVKWLDREIRFARKDVSVCESAGLTLPSNVTLPTESDLKDPADANSDIYIGEKPVVDAAPRVIHGDVKY